MNKQDFMAVAEHGFMQRRVECAPGSNTEETRGWGKPARCCIAFVAKMKCATFRLAIMLTFYCLSYVSFLFAHVRDAASSENRVCDENRRIVRN